MKDAKGHGSNPRGGDHFDPIRDLAKARSGAAHQHGVNSAVPALVVYHGTPREPFDQFDRMAGEPARHGRDTVDMIGHWFTTDPKDARGFGNNVLAATLAIRNPLIVRGWDGFTAIAKRNNLERTEGKTRDFYQISGTKMRAWLIKKGYDGVRMIGGEDSKPGLDYWVALHPEQISGKWSKVP